MVLAPSQLKNMSPLAKMRAAFPRAYEKTNGWWTQDDNPHFDFQETEDGIIRIHSWTSRNAETILAMGSPPLKLSDLYPKNGTYTPKYREKQLDLLSLAHYYKLDWKYLYAIGYRDGYIYKNKMGHRTVCVKLGGYCTPDGEEHSKVKVRLSIDGTVRFLWDQNTPGVPIPCGLHTFPDAARKAGYGLVGEGPSDYATCNYHGFPFLGINGADAVKQLDVSLLHGIPRIYIIEEPDQAEKNSETGQGFYASVRTHLRDNGYTGEICSIRFKLATGYKDPSNLHKAIYRACDQAEEAPFLSEVKAKFTDVMFQAMEHAIPEGNASLSTQELFAPDPPPPLPDTDKERLEWVEELCAVPANTLSPAQKIVLMVIILHSHIWSETGQYWWHVEAGHLCKFAGMSKQQFLAHLAYLTNNVKLFIKHHDREWITDEKTGKKTVLTSDLYIKPSPDTWLARPSTYKVVEGAKERKHGGKQTPKPRCQQCQSEDMVELTAYYCRTCKHVQYELPPEESDGCTEGTAVVLPLQDEKTLPESQFDIPGVFSDEEDHVDEKTLPEHENSLPIYIYKKDMNSHVPGVFSEQEPAEEKTHPDCQIDFPGVFLEEAVVMSRLHATKGDPCRTCGCTLYHAPPRFPDERWCCKCLPPRGIPDDVWRWLKDRYSPSKQAGRRGWAEVQS